MVMSSSQPTKEMQVSQYIYELTETHIDDLQDISYTTYGIQALDSDQKVVVAYADVLTNRVLVEELVHKCNLLELDVLHLQDVIWDLIG